MSFLLNEPFKSFVCFKTTKTLEMFFLNKIGEKISKVKCKKIEGMLRRKCCCYLQWNLHLQQWKPLNAIMVNVISHFLLSYVKSLIYLRLLNKNPRLLLSFNYTFGLGPSVQIKQVFYCIISGALRFWFYRSESPTSMFFVSLVTRASNFGYPLSFLYSS